MPAGALSSAPKRRLKGGGKVESPRNSLKSRGPLTGLSSRLVGRRPIRTARIVGMRGRTDIDENGAMRCAKVAAANRAAESVGLFDLERAENR